MLPAVLHTAYRQEIAAHDLPGVPELSQLPAPAESSKATSAGAGVSPRGIRHKSGLQLRHATFSTADAGRPASDFTPGVVALGDAISTKTRGKSGGSEWGSNPQSLVECVSY